MAVLIAVIGFSIAATLMIVGVFIGSDRRDNE